LNKGPVELNTKGLPDSFPSGLSGKFASSLDKTTNYKEKQKYTT